MSWEHELAYLESIIKLHLDGEDIYIHNYRISIIGLLVWLLCFPFGCECHGNNDIIIKWHPLPKIGASIHQNLIYPKKWHDSGVGPVSFIYFCEYCSQRDSILFTTILLTVGCYVSFFFLVRGRLSLSQFLTTKKLSKFQIGPDFCFFVSSVFFDFSFFFSFTCNWRRVREYN